MTRTEEYMRYRADGLSYQKIADMYGVSRQAVHSAIYKHDHRCANVKPSTVVFDGLRQWMMKNHVFVTDLERATGKNLRHTLRTGIISADKAKAILAVTGASREEMFGKMEAR